eukprot:c17541_g1_i1.p1 GENE.c17541_g1_i1~~c17541_g1_i1.p1  ORF type:complete len:136 (-),score=27.29 c17541_g1_i1:682-1089(-)
MFYFTISFIPARETIDADDCVLEVEHQTNAVTAPQKKNSHNIDDALKNVAKDTWEALIPSLKHSHVCEFSVGMCCFSKNKKHHFHIFHCCVSGPNGTASFAVEDRVVPDNEHQDQVIADEWEMEDQLDVFLWACL